jgi:hypothetical protein
MWLMLKQGPEGRGKDQEYWLLRYYYRLLQPSKFEYPTDVIEMVLLEDDQGVKEV